MEDRQGRATEAVGNYEKALELDPRNFFTLRQLAFTYLGMRRFAEAAATLERAQALDPQDSGTAGTSSYRLISIGGLIRSLCTKHVRLMINENPAVAQDWSESWIYLALCERDPDLAKRAMEHHRGWI